MTTVETGAVSQEQSNEARYRTLFDTAPDVIYAISPGGLFTDLSPAFEALTGWKVEEWIGRSFGEIVHPEDVQVARERFARELRGAPEDPAELRILTTAGSYLVGEFQAVPNVEDGRVIGVVGIARDVTARSRMEQELARAAVERQRVEEELRGSRDELEAILEGIDEGITALNANGEIVYANEAAARLSGVSSPDELIGTLPDFLRRYELADQIGTTISAQDLPGRKVLRGESGAEVLIRYRLQSTGEERMSSVRATPVYDDEGNVRLAINIFKDVTAPTEAETLRARLAAIVQSVDDAVMGKDLDGIITSWNPGAERLYGYTADEMIGKSVSILVAPERPDEELEILGRLRRGEQLDDFETERVRKDGSHLHISMSVSPIRSRSGEIVGAATIARDVTRAKEAEMERDRLLAAEQEARSRAEVGQKNSRFLADSSNILAGSLDYETTLVNVARLVVTHLADWCLIDVVEDDGTIRRVALTHPDPAKEELARELENLYPSDPDTSRVTLEEVRRSGSQLYEEISDAMIEPAARDEEHLKILKGLGLKSAIVVPLAARNGVIGMVSLLSAESGRVFTVDDVVLAEELGRRAGMAVDNARLYRQAQEALAMRDEFLSIASHELKTPLTSLQLQTQMLDRYVATGSLSRMDPERQSAILQGVERQIRRLSRLINDLLDVSRIAAGKFEIEPEDVDLAAVVRDVVDRFGQEIHLSASEVTVSIEKPVVGVWDRFRVDQVVTNLVSNAIKYGRAEEIDITVGAGKRNAWVKVRDRGIGISDENLARVFDRFERVALSSSYGGLGLGLYIARQIVEAHDGSIEVTSDVGKGTTFTMKLPLKRPAKPPE